MCKVSETPVLLSCQEGARRVGVTADKGGSKEDKKPERERGKKKSQREGEGLHASMYSEK